MLYRAVCRDCGYVLTEGSSKEIVIDQAKRGTCRDCKAEKWKITEKEHGSDIIDTTENSDDDPSQSSLGEY